jgi:hypothetical protein
LAREIAAKTQGSALQLPERTDALC